MHLAEPEPARRPARRELQRAAHQLGGGRRARLREQHLGIVGAAVGERGRRKEADRGFKSVWRPADVARAGICARSGLQHKSLFAADKYPILTAMRARDLLHPRPEGLYCPPGDFFIDPVRPVPRALITHGHSDHARAGHGECWRRRETLDIMAHALWRGFRRRRRRRRRWARTLRVDGVDGHASIRPAMCWAPRRSRVEHGGTRIVASGDYKRRADPTCAPLRAGHMRRLHHRGDVRPAGVPPPAGRRGDGAAAEIGRRSFPSASHLVGAYALGKAQRVIRLIRDAGYDEPIYIHGALQKLCDYYQSQGIDLGQLRAGDRGAGHEERLRRRDRRSARRPPSPTAGRGAFPIRSPASRPAGCASASAPSSAASNCR